MIGKSAMIVKSSTKMTVRPHPAVARRRPIGPPEFGHCLLRRIIGERNFEAVDVTSFGQQAVRLHGWRVTPEDVYEHSLVLHEILAAVC